MAEEVVEGAGGQRPGILVRIITGFVLIVVTMIWTVVGFLLWVPFLTRMMLIFMAAVVTTIYRNSDPSKAKMGLEHAMTFYIRGFEMIFASMQNRLEGRQFNPESPKISWVRVLIEVGFAVFFWGGIAIWWAVALNYGLVKFSGVMPSANVVYEGKSPPPKIADIKAKQAVLINDFANKAYEFCDLNAGWCKSVVGPGFFWEWCKRSSEAVRRLGSCNDIQYSLPPKDGPPFDAGQYDQMSNDMRQILFKICDLDLQDCKREEPVVFAKYCFGKSLNGCW